MNPTTIKDVSDDDVLQQLGIPPKKSASVPKEGDRPAIKNVADDQVLQQLGIPQKKNLLPVSPAGGSDNSAIKGSSDFYTPTPISSEPNRDAPGAATPAAATAPTATPGTPATPATPAPTTSTIQRFTEPLPGLPASVADQQNTIDTIPADFNPVAGILTDKQRAAKQVRDLLTPKPADAATVSAFKNNALARQAARLPKPVDPNAPPPFNVAEFIRNDITGQGKLAASFALPKQPAGGDPNNPQNVFQSQDIAKSIITDPEKFQQYHLQRSNELDQQLLEAQNNAAGQSVEGQEIPGDALGFKKKLADITAYRNNFYQAADYFAGLTAAQKAGTNIMQTGRLKKHILNDPTLKDDINNEKHGWAINPENSYTSDAAGIGAQNDLLESQYADDVPKDDAYWQRKQAIVQAHDTLGDRHKPFVRQQYGRLIGDQIAANLNANVATQLIKQTGMWNTRNYVDLAVAQLRKKGINVPDDVAASITRDDIPHSNIVSTVFGDIYNQTLKLGAGILTFGTGAVNLAGSPFGVGVDPEEIQHFNEEQLASGEKIFQGADIDQLRQSPTMVDTRPGSATYLQNMRNPDGGKTNYTFSSISNGIAKGAAEFAGFIYGSKALGKLFSLAPEAVQAEGVMAPLEAAAARAIPKAGTEAADMVSDLAEGADMVAAKKAEQLAKFQHNAGMTSYMIGSGYNANYNDAAKIIHAIGPQTDLQTELKRHTYAIMNGYIQKLVFDILPTGSYAKTIEGLGKTAAQEDLAKALNSADNPFKDMQSVHDALTAPTKNLLIASLPGALKETGKIGAANVAGILATRLLSHVMGNNKPAIDEGDAQTLNEITSSIKDLPMTMMVPLTLLEMARIKNHGQLFKESAYDMGMNPDAYVAKFHQMITDGYLSEGDARKKAEIIAVMNQTAEGIPDVDALGDQLSHAKRVDYNYNRLKEIALAVEAQKAKDGGDDVLYKMYGKEIAAHQKAREDLMNGQRNAEFDNASDAATGLSAIPITVERELKKKGFSQAEINNMNPADANDILQPGDSKPFINPTGGVPAFLTKKMESDLSDLGYSDDDIYKMETGKAHKILSGKIVNPDKPAVNARPNATYSEPEGDTGTMMHQYPGQNRFGFNRDNFGLVVKDIQNGDVISVLGGENQGDLPTFRGTFEDDGDTSVVRSAADGSTTTLDDLRRKYKKYHTSIFLYTKPNKNETDQKQGSGKSQGTGSKPKNNGTTQQTSSTGKENAGNGDGSATDGTTTIVPGSGPGSDVVTGDTGSPAGAGTALERARTLLKAPFRGLGKDESIRFIAQQAHNADANVEPAISDKDAYDNAVKTTKPLVDAAMEAHPKKSFTEPADEEVNPVNLLPQKQRDKLHPPKGKPTVEVGDITDSETAITEDTDEAKKLIKDNEALKKEAADLQKKKEGLAEGSDELDAINGLIHSNSEKRQGNVREIVASRSKVRQALPIMKQASEAKGNGQKFLNKLKLDAKSDEWVEGMPISKEDFNNLNDAVKTLGVRQTEATSNEELQKDIDTVQEITSKEPGANISTELDILEKKYGVKPKSEPTKKPQEPGANISTSEQKPQAPTSLKEVLDAHEASATATFPDLVDAVEAFAKDNGHKAILPAVEKYRKEQADDAELGGRGDMDQAEADFQKSLDAEIEGTEKPKPGANISTSENPIHDALDKFIDGKNIQKDVADTAKVLKGALPNKIGDYAFHKVMAVSGNWQITYRKSTERKNIHTGEKYDDVTDQSFPLDKSDILDKTPAELQKIINERAEKNGLLPKKPQDTEKRKRDLTNQIAANDREAATTTNKQRLALIKVENRKLKKQLADLEEPPPEFGVKSEADVIAALDEEPDQSYPMVIAPEDSNFPIDLYAEMNPDGKIEYVLEVGRKDGVRYDTYDKALKAFDDVVDNWENKPDLADGSEDAVHPSKDAKDVFPKPKATKNFTTDLKTEIPQAQADAIVQAWKDNAKRIGKEEDHSHEVVISLFDASGTWSQPYKDAGYTVIRYDLSRGDDIMQMDWVSLRNDIEASGKKVIGILSAPPCTSFSGSGARWWAAQHDNPSKEWVEKKYGSFAGEYFDNPLEYAVMLVDQVKAATEFLNPTLFHVAENPVGRIQKEAGLHDPTMVINPNNFGDPYTKKTMLWGVMNTDLPTANVNPTEGSKIHKLRGDNPEQKAERSQTPEGFAYAFFQANNTSTASANISTPKAPLITKESFKATHGVEYDAIEAQVVKYSEFMKTGNPLTLAIGDQIKKAGSKASEADVYNDFVKLKLQDLPTKLPNKKQLFDGQGLTGEIQTVPIPQKITPVEDTTAGRVKSLAAITGDDELRPAMTGVYHDVANHVLAATDAHMLVWIDDKTLEGETRIVHPKTGAVIDARFPNFRAVIPKDNPITIPGLPVAGLLAQTAGIARANKFIEGTEGAGRINSVIKIGEDFYSFEPQLLNNVLKVMAENGAKTVTLELSTPTRAMEISTPDNPNVHGLIMPRYSAEGMPYTTIFERPLTEAERTAAIRSDISDLERQLKTRLAELAKVDGIKNKRTIHVADAAYIKIKIKDLQAQIADKKELLEPIIKPTGNVQNARDTETITGEAETTAGEIESAEEGPGQSAAIEKADDLIDEIDSKLKLLGHYTSEGDTNKDFHENGSQTPEKKFKKDLVKFSKELAGLLGYEHDVRKKKTEYANTNIAPIGGNGTIILWKPGSSFGVYISIPSDRDAGHDSTGDVGNDTLTVKATFMWRVNDRDNKYGIGSNQWEQSDITAGELAQKIKQAVDAAGKPQANPDFSLNNLTPEETEILDGELQGDGITKTDIENYENDLSGKSVRRPSDNAPNNGTETKPVPQDVQQPQNDQGTGGEQDQGGTTVPGQLGTGATVEYAPGERANYYDDLFDRTVPVTIISTRGTSGDQTRYAVEFEGGKFADVWTDKLSKVAGSGTIDSIRAEIARIEKRPVVTKADRDVIDRLKKRIQDIEGQPSGLSGLTQSRNFTLPDPTTPKPPAEKSERQVKLDRIKAVQEALKAKMKAAGLAPPDSNGVEDPAVQYTAKEEGGQMQIPYEAHTTGDYPSAEATGDQNTVRGVWNELKDLQFSGSVKIKNHADVAHIMRLLETKQVEHAFAVHLDAKGRVFLQFLGIGGRAEASVDNIGLLAGAIRHNAVETYLVHNHPSNEVVPSKQDFAMTADLREGLDRFGIKLQHIIMDGLEGKYGVIDEENNAATFQRDMDNPAKAKIKLHAFNEVEVLTKPLGRILSSDGAVKVIQQLKFSAMPKKAALIMNSNNVVLANYILSDYGDVAAMVAAVPGATSVIFYGNVSDMKGVEAAQKLLKNFKIKVTDYITSNSSGSDIRDAYESASDDGRLLADIQEKYGTAGVGKSDNFNNEQKTLPSAGGNADSRGRAAGDVSEDTPEYQTPQKNEEGPSEAEILQSALDLVDAYVDADITGFADILQAFTDGFGGVKTPGILLALKKAYVSYGMEHDVEAMDDNKTVKNYTYDDLKKHNFSDAEQKLKDEPQPDTSLSNADGQSETDVVVDQSTGGAQGNVGTGNTSGKPGKRSGTGSPDNRGSANNGPEQAGGASGSGGKNNLPISTSTTETDTDDGPGISGYQGQTGRLKPLPVNPSDQNHIIEPGDVLVPDGLPAKIAANMDAYLLSRTIEEESRNPTPEEKKILTKFSGWGQVAGYLKGIEDAIEKEIFEHIFLGKEKKLGYGSSAANLPATDKLNINAKSFEEIVKAAQNKYNQILSQYPRLTWQVTNKTLPLDIARGYVISHLLDPAEFQSAGTATINSHPTDRGIISAMWDLMRQLGFTGGNFLESSAGVGLFFGLMPKDLQTNSNLTGVELDKTTGRILKQLYPDANIQVKGFEQTNFPNNSQDAAMTNVPFAADGFITDPNNKDIEGFNLHNYFIANNLKKLKPGGLGIFITSKSTMDNAASAKARRWFLSPEGGNSELVGAIRLPNNAFDKNAGTQVTTDIMVFKKRKDKIVRNINPFAATVLQRSEVYENELAEIYLNEYYVAHPENMIGKMKFAHEVGSGGLYGKTDATLHADEGTDVVARVKELIKEFPSDIADTEFLPETEGAVSTEEKAGKMFVDKGKVYVSGGEQGVELPLDAKKKKIAVDYVPVRDAIRNIVSSEISGNRTDQQIADDRVKLNDLYDEFVNKHGTIAANDFLYDHDVEYSIAAAAEDVKVSTILSLTGGKSKKVVDVAKGPVFQGRVNYPRTEPDTADSLPDAIQISLAYRNTIDPDYVASMLGIEPAKALEQMVDQKLVYQNPSNGVIETPEEYLSGNVRKKLLQAQEAAVLDPNYSRNVVELEKIQPEDKSISAIPFRMGVNWIPASMYMEFISEKLGVQVPMSYIEKGGMWVIDKRHMEGEYDSNNTTTYAVRSDHKGMDIVADILANRSTLVKDVVSDGKGGTLTVPNARLTEDAARMQTKIIDEFRQWIASHEDHAQAIERVYNDRFNNLVEKKHKLPPFKYFPGASQVFKLREHQFKSILRAIPGNPLLLAHGVGTGKAQPLYSKVLTPTGWTQMGDLQVGDQVISADGNPTNVTAIFPQGKKQIYKVRFSDGSSTECCDEHLWLTWNENERKHFKEMNEKGKDWPGSKPKVRRLRDMMDDLYVRHGVVNYSIPVTKPVNFIASDVPVHPYLLGVLIGDGSLAHGMIRLACMDEDLVDSLHELLPADIFIKEDKVKDARCKSYSFLQKARTGFGKQQSQNRLREAIKEMNLNCTSYHKFIPNQYKFNSIEVRTEMLRGLMDTDGTVDKRSGKSVEFTSASERLVDDVIFLVQSLGGTASKRTKTTNIGTIAFTSAICLPADINPFNLKRKRDLVTPKTKYIPARHIVSVEWVGLIEAQCITVNNPSHLYLTDDLIVTHNTAIIQTIAMEWRRLKTAKKPMIVVQNATLKDFAKKFAQLYPGARLLSTSEKDKGQVERRRFYARIQQGDWDAIVITQPQLDMIPDNPDRVAAILQERIDEIKQILNSGAEQEFYIKTRFENQIKGLEDQIMQAYMTDEELAALKTSASDMYIDENTGELVKADAPGKKKKGGKQKVKADAEKLLRIRARVQKQANRKTDNVMYFEDMGIDGLIIDEAHEYKKLGFQTGMTKIRGVDTGVSQKALSLKMKIDAVKERTGGKNLVFATGTPITNTMAEAWTMMRYIMPEALDEMGIQYFDQFANTFAQVEDSLEHNAGGRAEIVQRLAVFVNTHQLQAAFRNSADVVTAEDIPEFMSDPDNAPPTVAGGGMEPILIPVSKLLQATLQKLTDHYDWWKSLAGDHKRELSYLPLVLYQIAKKASLDLRLVDPRMPDDPDSKVNHAVIKALELYRQYDQYKATQMIFADTFQTGNSKNVREILGVPEGLTPFNLYHEIRDKLMRGGVPRSEIVIMNELTKPDQVLDMMDKMNSGELRFAIGSTQKMGVGVNAHHRMIGLHHLDVPDRPDQFIQRNGREVRSGNMFTKLKIPVHIFPYGIEETRDATGYTRLLKKNRFVTDFISGKGADTMEDVGAEDDSKVSHDYFAEISAKLQGGKYAIELLFAEKALSKELNKAESFRQRRAESEYKLHNKISGREKVKDYIKTADEVHAVKIAAFPDNKVTSLTIEGKEVNQKLGDALDEQIDKAIKEYGDELKRLQKEAKDAGLKTSKVPKASMIKFKINGLDARYTYEKPHEIVDALSQVYIPSLEMQRLATSGPSVLAVVRNYIKDIDEQPQRYRDLLKKEEANIETLKKTLTETYDQDVLDELTKRVAGLKSAVLAESAAKEAADKKAVADKKKLPPPPPGSSSVQEPQGQYMARDNSKFKDALRQSRTEGISNREFDAAIRKANGLRDRASDLPLNDPARYDLGDEADRIEREATGRINEFDNVVDTALEIASLPSKKLNEARCRTLSIAHQKKYGGTYREVEVTNADGSKVIHAVVEHDNYVYEPQTNSLIQKDAFNDFFHTSLGKSQFIPTLIDSVEALNNELADENKVDQAQGKAALARVNDMEKAEVKKPQPYPAVGNIPDDNYNVVGEEAPEYGKHTLVGNYTIRYGAENTLQDLVNPRFNNRGDLVGADNLDIKTLAPDGILRDGTLTDGRGTEYKGREINTFMREQQKNQPPIAKPKSAADKFREAKDFFGSLPPGLYTMVLPVPQVWNATIETVAKLIEGGTAISKAFKTGLDNIRREYPDDKWQRDKYNEEMIEALKANGTLSYNLGPVQKKEADIIIRKLKKGASLTQQVRALREKFKTLKAQFTDPQDIADIEKANAEFERYMYDHMMIWQMEKATKGNMDLGLEKQTFYQKMVENTQDSLQRLHVVKRAMERAGITIEEANDIVAIADRYKSIAEAKKDDVLKKIGLASTDIMIWKAQKKIPGSLFDRMAKDGVDYDKLGLYVYATHAPERNVHNAKRRREKLNVIIFDLQNDIADLQAQPPTPENDVIIAKLQESLDDHEEYRDAYSDPSIPRNLVELLAAKIKGEARLMDDGGSGMTNQQAAEIIAEASKVRPDGTSDLQHFQKYEKEYRDDIITKNLALRLEYDLMNQDEYDRLAGTATKGSYYTNYWPLKVVQSYFDKGETFTNSGLSGAKIYASKGASHITFLDRVNPLTQAVLDLQATITTGERNRYLQTIAQAIADAPDKKVWETRGAKYKIRTGKNGQPIGPPQEIGIPTGKNPNEIPFKAVGAKKRYLVINDESLKKALTGENVWGAIPVLSQINGILRNIYTTYNPAFTVVNLIRDLQTAGIVLSKTQDATVRKNFAANVASIFSLVRGSYLEQGDNLSTENAKWAREYKDMGGNMTWQHQQPIEDMIKDIEGMFKAYEKKPTFEFGLGAARSFADFLSRMNNSVETATRVAMYKSLVEAGISKHKAVEFARNATINFNKKGNWSGIMDSLFLFTNPAIQGTANMWRTMLTSKKGAAYATGIGLVGLTQALLNHAFSNCDDPDHPEDCYENIPDYEREKNMMIRVPGGHGYIKIPMAYGFSFFHNVGETIGQLLLGKITVAKASAYLGNSFLDNFNPIANADTPFMQVITPTFLDPVTQWLTNRDGLGRPIYDKQKYTHKPESETGEPHNTQMAKDMARWLNSHTGGDDKIKGKIDVSPGTLDWITQTIFGGMGLFIKQGAGAVEPLGETVFTSQWPFVHWNPKALQAYKQVDPKDIPIVNRFYSQPKEKIDKGDIYDVRNRSYNEILPQGDIDQMQTEINQAVKQGKMDADKGEEYMKTVLKNQFELKNPAVLAPLLKSKTETLSAEEIKSFHDSMDALAKAGTLNDDQAQGYKSTMTKYQNKLFASNNQELLAPIEKSKTEILPDTDISDFDTKLDNLVTEGKLPLSAARAYKGEITKNQNRLIKKQKE